MATMNVQPNAIAVPALVAAAAGCLLMAYTTGATSLQQLALQPSSTLVHPTVPIVAQPVGRGPQRPVLSRAKGLTHLTSTVLPIATPSSIPTPNGKVVTERGVIRWSLMGIGLVITAVILGLRRALVDDSEEVLQPFAILATAAPKTGHHTVEEDLMAEALDHFFEDPASIVVTPTTGGVNNVVQYLTTPDGQRFILRIYNNGNKSEKVVWEHEILRQVGQQPLSFEVPKPLPAKSGATHVLLSSGAECCIFHVIPGNLAKTTSPEEVGRATGELCTALGNVRVDMKGPIAPYWDVFAAHHAIGGNKALFYHEAETNPAFKDPSCKEAMDYLVAQIRLMEDKLEQFHKLDLPKQIVHGDLHYDNVMVVGDSVSGLLDFEFCAYDWRGMELAVALSKYVGEDEPLPLIQAFVDGYAKYGRLTPTETSIIPDLINLRIFSNVIYFTSRALAKEDSIESLTSRANAYAKRVQWINANRDAIANAIQSRMPVN